MHVPTSLRVPVLPVAGPVEARRAVDRLTVRTYPRARVAKYPRLELRDGAVGIGADVQQEVAALGHGLDEQRHHLGRGEVVFDALVAVHAERIGEPPAELPSPIGRDIGHVVLVHGVVVLRREPAVVHDEVDAALAGHCTRVGEHLVGTPVPARVSPVPVAPEQRGLEPLDQFLDLRTHVRVDIALLVGIVAMAPIEERVVAAEHVAPAPNGVGELRGHITLRAQVHRGALRKGGVPPTKAVVVLGDVHQVAHACVIEELRVRLGVETVEGEPVDEVVEGVSASVLGVPRDHFRQRTGRVQHHVGLGLEERPVPVGVLVHRGERGHGRDVRVHEHAVPALVEPSHLRRTLHNHLSRAPFSGTFLGPFSQATRSIATRTSTLRSGGPWNTPLSGATSP